MFFEKYSLYLNHFIGFLIIVYIERFKYKMLNTNKDYLIMIGFVVSVFFHELSHFIIAFLTNGKPSSFTVIPSGDEKQGWTLGSINANVKFYNAFCIGLAPLLILIPIAFIFYSTFFEYAEQNIINTIFFYLILAILLSNSIPSQTDIVIAFKVESIIFISTVVVLFYTNLNIIGKIYETITN